MLKILMIIIRLKIKKSNISSKQQRRFSEENHGYYTYYKSIKIKIYIINLFT